MWTDALSSLGMLLGSTGIFLYLIKMQNNKLSEIDEKKLDKEIFLEHQKSFDELKSEVKDSRNEMKDLRNMIVTNNELLIRVDERIQRMRD